MLQKNSFHLFAVLEGFLSKTFIENSFLFEIFPLHFVLRFVNLGYLGENKSPNCGCTTVQKTHGWTFGMAVPDDMKKRLRHIVYFDGRGILILRNPYNVFVSQYNYVGGGTNGGGHTAYAKLEAFKTPRKYVPKSIAFTS